MFTEIVLAKLVQVPRGRVTTYAELARAINHPGAARAVGNALKKNEHLKTVPCHRVVKSSGEVGGFVLGQAMKIKYLEAEGVQIAKGRVVDFYERLYKF